MGHSSGTLDTLHERKLCVSLQPNVIVRVRIQEWEAITLERARVGAWWSGTDSLLQRELVLPL